MFRTARIISIFLAVGLALPALAQDKPAEGEGTFDGDLAIGEKAEPQVGDTYTASRHGDWRVNCVKTKDGKDPCQMYQLLSDGQGNAVAEMTVFDVPNQSQAVAGSTIITPLGTLLTAQLTFSVDGEEGKRYPFSWCIQSGCYARIGFTALELDTLRRGKVAEMAIRAVQQPDQPIRVPISLKGFSDAFRDLQDRTPD